MRTSRKSLLLDTAIVKNHIYVEEVFMTLIKAFLTGLAGVSVCTANISGIVTDTGTTPIAGVVVRLENGGQTGLSGTDGRFMIATTAILRGNGKSMPNGLSAGIAGTIINISIEQRAPVKVETFNLAGKSLSTMLKILDAGSHSIALPYRGAGIFLYKIKSGNRELVLKGGASYGSSVAFRGSSLQPLVKQALNAVEIYDVIAATKTGYLNYRAVVGTSDTSGIVIRMIACAGTITDADGNAYQTVRIGNQVWTAENLRVTKYNDGSPISLDTSSITWKNAATPKYCFYQNTIDSKSITKYGAIYNWYVVSPANPKKIAPAGWHVPSDAEWDTLQNFLIAKGYNWDSTFTDNRIAKSLAANTDWALFSFAGSIGANVSRNNRSGFSALPGGCRDDKGTFEYQGNIGFWWSATEGDATGAWNRYLYYDRVGLFRHGDYKSCGIAVRLLKD